MNVVALNTEMAAVERALIAGDLGKLTTEQRTVYYREVCKSVGLNPLTQPFRYIALEGQLQLYATKACAEQLRMVHGVSIKIVSRSTDNGVHTVHVSASTRDGREDEEIGAVSLVKPDFIKGKVSGYVANPEAGQMVPPGELANLMMKALTKAKRRATLSVCGLAMLDETQIEDMTVQPTAPERVTPLNVVNVAPDVFDGVDVPCADDVPVIHAPTPEPVQAPVPVAAEPVTAPTVAELTAAAPASAPASMGSWVKLSIPIKSVMETVQAAVMASETVAPAPVAAKSEPRLSPGELTNKIIEAIMNISKPERIDDTVGIFKSRAGWSDLDEAQLASINTAATIMKSMPMRKRRAAHG